MVDGCNTFYRFNLYSDSAINLYAQNEIHVNENKIIYSNF